jgi:hypothetical protein
MYPKDLNTTGQATFGTPVTNRIWSQAGPGSNVQISNLTLQVMIIVKVSVN